MIGVRPQGRNSKLELRNSASLNRTAPDEFRLSNFEVRRFAVLRTSLLLVLILTANACNWFNPQPLRQAERLELASEFTNAVKNAGGAHIRIRRSGRSSRGQNSDIVLRVLATSTAYRAVLSAVRRESDKHSLDLGISSSSAGAGQHAVTLNVMQRSGNHVIQIQLREVPRLLRAAIVIDDIGNDFDAAHKLLAIQYPLTLSVLPYLRYSQLTAQEAHRRGREVMLHLPMEPEPGAHVSPGEGAILVGMTAGQVQKVVENDLEAIPYAAGVNNHMGSRATQDAALMAEVMKTLANHRLYFIDSRTTGASLALKAARHEGVPAFYRAVFLDDTETVSYTLGQLREFRHTVEQEGVALAIGHPHATTITALEKFLPEFERADIELVPPSQIVGLTEVTSLSVRCRH